MTFAKEAEQRSSGFEQKAKFTEQTPDEGWPEAVDPTASSEVQQKEESRHFF